MNQDLVPNQELLIRQEIEKLKYRKRGGFLGHHHTPETKKKISISRQARILSSETKQKISVSNKGGGVVSPETILKKNSGGSSP